MTDTWLTFIQTQCPVLYRLITDRTGQVDQKAVEHILEKFEPCRPGQEDCLERQCSALWRYYVATRHKTHDTPHEVRNIADHLFAERDNLSFRPGSLSFLYEVHRSTTDDQRDQRIVRRAGQTVLRVEEEGDEGDIHSFDILRVLLLEHPALREHFVSIYALERSVQRPLKLYLLMEAMDGSLADFQREFARRDPHFWHRFARMLLHAWRGLHRLHALGYSFGHVTLDNVLFRMKWDQTNDSAGLLAVKWRCPRGMSQKPEHLSRDWVKFAHMVCGVLWGTKYEPLGSLSATCAHELEETPHLQPLSAWASRVLSRPTAWSESDMLTFLEERAPDFDVLSPIPVGRHLPVYSDW